jgi:hypothetical protein
MNVRAYMKEKAQYKQRKELVNQTVKLAEQTYLGLNHVNSIIQTGYVLNSEQLANILKLWDEEYINNFIIQMNNYKPFLSKLKLAGISVILNMIHYSGDKHIITVLERVKSTNNSDILFNCGALDNGNIILSNNSVKDLLLYKGSQYRLDITSLNMKIQSSTLSIMDTICTEICKSTFEGIGMRKSKLIYNVNTLNSMTEFCDKLLNQYTNNFKSNEPLEEEDRYLFSYDANIRDYQDLITYQIAVLRARIFLRDYKTITEQEKGLDFDKFPYDLRNIFDSLATYLFTINRNGVNHRLAIDLDEKERKRIPYLYTITSQLNQLIKPENYENPELIHKLAVYIDEATRLICKECRTDMEYKPNYNFNEEIQKCESL